MIHFLHHFFCLGGLHVFHYFLIPTIGCFDSGNSASTQASKQGTGSTSGAQSPVTLGDTSPILTNSSQTTIGKGAKVATSTIGGSQISIAKGASVTLNETAAPAPAPTAAPPTIITLGSSGDGSSGLGAIGQEISSGLASLTGPQPASAPPSLFAGIPSNYLFIGVAILVIWLLFGRKK